jgi:type IV pilus assembly protein PilB
VASPAKPLRYARGSMNTTRVRLGELLVSAQIITRQQLEDVLALQKTDGRRIGKLLVEHGIVTETQVTQIVSQQLSVPWVSLYHIDFSRQLLDLVAQELAEKYCLVPIFVRRVRGSGETLYVAMDDPSDEAAQREVSEWCRLPVRAMIAPPSDIRSAIRVYYGGGKDSASLSDAVAELDAEEASKSVQAPEVHVIVSEPPRAGMEGQPLYVSDPPKHIPSVLPTPEPERDSSPEVPVRELSMPAPPAGKTKRMVTLTLLDGTQVNLPARTPQAKNSDKPPHNASGELTAHDLVAALRAVSHGADASEILGDQVQWEALFAALLSLLMKKHLIADWEFVDEYRQI